MCSLKRRGERKRSFNLGTHCYCYCCCYYIQYRKRGRESEREREKRREEERKRAREKCNCICYSSWYERERRRARKSRTLISINCSVHETQERIMQTFIQHRHSSEFKLIYIYAFKDTYRKPGRVVAQKSPPYTSAVGCSHVRTYSVC